jgi:prepilin-type N-terminal cleavage/methylation domain-containing protein
MAQPLRRPAGFSLVEMLTVLAIIAILIGIILAAISGVMRTAGRDRARSEIKTMESALESYKSDNGNYPAPGPAGFSSTNDYTGYSPLSSTGPYQGSSAFLYEQLSGYTNGGYVYGAAITPPGHVYYAFSQGQLGNNKPSAGGPVYIKDPWGNSYGYFFSTNVNLPYNGTNQYDVWSTGSDPSNPPTNLPSWITDWSN